MNDKPLALDSFEPDDVEPALPFAGRDEAFALLNHHLSDPVNTECVAFVGRRRIGKTALLGEFARQLAPSFSAVYIPLRHEAIHSEEGFLLTLSRAIMNAVSSQGYPVVEAEPSPDDSESLRDWFSDQCIPAAMRVIRHRRRMVLLLDDLDAFMGNAGQLVVPPDTFAYLHSLRRPDLGIAVTIDLVFDDRLRVFSPLVNTSSIHRLTRLTSEQTSQLLCDPKSGLNTIVPDAVAIIHRETGGEPALAQHFIAHLRNMPEETITADDVKGAIPAAYASGSEELYLLWSLLNPEEKRVLSAISSLKYRDPLRPVDTDAIESWLVRTDYPTDFTTINRAVRSMEYYGIVEGGASDISICAGLMHRWLLENAESESEKIIMSGNWKSLILALAVVVIFIMVLLALLSDGTRQQPGVATPMPTAPLSNSE